MLRDFLGDPYYWLGFVVLSSFAALFVINNISMIYSEMFAWGKELFRVSGGQPPEDQDGQHDS